jgi:hypothetical protein
MSSHKPLLLLVAFLFWSRNAFAQSNEKEPAAVLELGGAGGWNVKGGAPAFGPDAAVEVTPIENRLELEAGVTPLFRRQSTEWSIDVLFKKPWTLSKKVEFMLGVGPEWIHTNERGRTPNSASCEAVVDVMFWRSRKHRFGWFVEPGYEYNFGRGHEQSIGLSGGLLIGVR